MRLRRRARTTGAHDALALVAAHADAGRQAQLDGAPLAWAPPGMDAAPAPAPGPGVAGPPAPAAPPPPPSPEPTSMQAEVLRVLEVVTRMCDHVIEFIEADRAERRLVIDALGNVAKALSAASANPPTPPPVPLTARERVIGGSMPAGPDPTTVDGVLDLVTAEYLDDEDAADADVPAPAVAVPEPSTTAVPVEVRCRFGEGERWVDGFEIVEVAITDLGPRYRLRRQRDGAVLPQLFDAANIRHVETFEQLDPPARPSWSRL